MKIKMILMMITLTVLVAGCNQSSGSSGNLRTFIGGTQGVEPSFELELPPTEVIAGDPFQVVVMLDNRGEYTVPGGTYSVSLKGFSPADFGVTSTDLTVTPTDDLIANVLNPDTGEVLDSYPVFIQVPESSDLAYEGALAGNTNLPFVAEVCYPYQTTANAKLCVKENLRKTQDSDVCTLSGPQPISSSGAPLQITDFKEFSGTADTVRFSFKIIASDNGGKVSALNSGCGTEYDQIDRVSVEVTTDLTNTPTCTGFLSTTATANGATTAKNSGEVKLSSGSRQISCTQKLAENEIGDYVKIVSITANYDYQKRLEKSVLFKPVLT